ncbi:outer membrane protein transport protein [Marinomonas arenicola]|uniref:OmpP1/FadL family transporter n=1 Tax=Marinomonas arenicola TaxID=569601 RepID=UPI00312045AF
MFKISLVTLSVAAASSAYSAGFSLGDQSATASGSALSTAAASSEDISFSYWNPALFLNAKKNTFYISGAYIIPKMDVSNIEATDASPSGLGGPQSISGSSSNTDSVDNTIVPSLYYAMPLSDDTVAGFSINAPFGLSGDYGDDWAGKFHATETGLQDIALSFSLAHRVNDWFSAGASVQVHKAEVTLKSQVGNTSSTFGAGALEGSGDIEADDIGYGYSLGVLFTPVKGTRIGVGYRSKIDFDFEGDVKYDNVATLNSVNTAYDLINTDVSDSLTFPDVLTISLEQALTPKLKLGLSVIRTGWSSMDEGLNIDFDSDQPNSKLSFGFEDQWMYSAGLTYDYSKKLTLRTGIARDNSPVTDEYRSARTPDGDRTWYSVGGTYHFTEMSSATFAYTYVDIEDVSVDRTDLPEDSQRGTYKADYSSSASVISLAYNMSF